MSDSPTCAKCGRELVYGADRQPFCPLCNEQLTAERQNSTTVSRWKIVKAVVAAGIGVVPGAIFVAAGQPLPLGVIIMVLGVFIGLAFALANVSVGNVAGLTAGVIIANNAPRSLRDHVLDSLTDNPDDLKKEGPAKGSDR